MDGLVKRGERAIVSTNMMCAGGPCAECGREECGENGVGAMGPRECMQRLTAGRALAMHASLGSMSRDGRWWHSAAAGKGLERARWQWRAAMDRAAATTIAPSRVARSHKKPMCETIRIINISNFTILATRKLQNANTRSSLQSSHGAALPRAPDLCSPES